VTEVLFTGMWQICGNGTGIAFGNQLCRGCRLGSGVFSGKLESAARSLAG